MPSKKSEFFGDDLGMVVDHCDGNDLVIEYVALASRAGE